MLLGELVFPAVKEEDRLEAKVNFDGDMLTPCPIALLPWKPDIMAQLVSQCNHLSAAGCQS